MRRAASSPGWNSRFLGVAGVVAGVSRDHDTSSSRRCSGSAIIVIVVIKWLMIVNWMFEELEFIYQSILIFRVRDLEGGDSSLVRWNTADS